MQPRQCVGPHQKYEEEEHYRLMNGEVSNDAIMECGRIESRKACLYIALQHPPTRCRQHTVARRARPGQMERASTQQHGGSDSVGHKEPTRRISANTHNAADFHIAVVAFADDLQQLPLLANTCTSFRPRSATMISPPAPTAML